MVKPTTDVVQDSAPDVLINLAGFGHHLRAGNRSPNTVSTYSAGVTLLDAFLADRGMPRTVANIRREHIEAFIEDLLARHRPATASNRYRSLQQFFRWLVDEGEIESSPMARMKPPTIPEEPPEILRDDAIAALRKVTSGTSFEERRDRAILELFLDTGMRRAELAGLKVDDLDDADRVAVVLGKGRRPRAVPYDNETAKVLFRYLRHARKNHSSAESPWLWLGKKGRLTENGISQVLRRRGKEAGLVGLHPHLFRHYSTHHDLASGMEETDVMRIKGWRSRQMVARYAASTGQDRAIASYRRVRAERQGSR